MDEAGGLCGLVVILLVIIVGLVVWMSSRQAPDPAPAPAPAPEVEAIEIDDRDRDDPEADATGLLDAWPLGRRASLGLLGALYFAGLFWIRPRAIRAKRNGATDQQAALVALTFFAFSPIVVPVEAAWNALGLLGRALTNEPGPEAKPRPPRSANDLD